MSDGNKRYADGLTDAADGGWTGRQTGGGEDGQRLSIYRGENKGLFVLVSRTQAGPGKARQNS